MKTYPKYFVALGLPLAFLAGCAGAANTTTAQTSPLASTAEAPEGSTAKAAEEKTGHKPAGAAGDLHALKHTTNLAFSSEPKAIPVGKPATWTLKVTDAKSGAPVKDFEVEMTKKMHLIVVKNDLSWFNHIHPTLKENGTFVVTATLPTSGTYKLYADYTLKGSGQEVPQHEFATGGAASAPSSIELAPDKMQGPWLTKKFNAHPEGEPDAKGGAVYQVALMPMPMPLIAGGDTMLHFQIRDEKNRPVKDLQPYLGAMGHCVILSQDTSKYLHSHPMAEGAEHDMSKMGAMDMSKMSHEAPPKSGGPNVMFHTNFPSGGLYKVWGQFQHKGKIITAAFVVNVGAAKAGAASAATVDESKPHTH